MSCPLAHDEIKFGRPKTAGWVRDLSRDKAKKGHARVQRTSWMMMEKVDVHWVPKTGGSDNVTWFPSAPGGRTRDQGGRVGTCISQDPPVVHPPSPMRSRKGNMASASSEPEL